MRNTFNERFPNDRYLEGKIFGMSKTHSFPSVATFDHYMEDRDKKTDTTLTYSCFYRSKNGSLLFSCINQERKEILACLRDLI